MRIQRNTHPVIKALVDANIDPRQFAEEKLNIAYQMLLYRLKLNRLHLDDYHQIMHYTGKRFEDLWPSPYEFSRKPIPLNFKKSKPAKPLTPEPVLLNPPKEVQEPEVRPVPAPSLSKEVSTEERKPKQEFKLLNVYGGIPKVDAEEDI